MKKDIDFSLDNAHIYVCGMTDSGKTTLTLSWLEKKFINFDNLCWFTMDPLEDHEKQLVMDLNIDEEIKIDERSLYSFNGTHTHRQSQRNVFKVNCG